MNSNVRKNLGPFADCANDIMPRRNFKQTCRRFRKLDIEYANRWVGEKRIGPIRFLRLRLRRFLRRSCRRVYRQQRTDNRHLKFQPDVELHRAAHRAKQECTIALPWEAEISALLAARRA